MAHSVQQVILVLTCYIAFYSSSKYKPQRVGLSQCSKFVSTCFKIYHLLGGLQPTCAFKVLKSYM